MNGTILISVEKIDENNMKLGVHTKIEHVNVVDKIILVKALMDSLEFSDMDNALLMTAMMSNNWPLDHLPNVAMKGTPEEIARQRANMEEDN